MPNSRNPKEYRIPNTERISGGSGYAVGAVIRISSFGLALMKILVANLGSTSLKWRLFDFSTSPERMLHKGGFERVTDYPQAIENCLAELKNAGAIQNESELTAVGFKTVLAKDVTGCVRLDERVLQAMADYNGLAPAHNPPYITGIKLFAQRVPKVPLIGLFETAFHQFASPAAV